MKLDYEGWGRFTLVDSIELGVKEIIYGVFERIEDYGNKAMKQWIAYRR